MKNFGERRRSFEAALKHDEELSFKLTARRNKLLGLWAAGHMRLTVAEDAEAYARTVVAADLEAPGDGDVITKLRSDFAASGLAIADTEIRAAMLHAAVEARRQLVNVSTPQYSRI